MAHADVLGERIIVQTQWNEKELIKQIPGSRWSTDLKMWTLPLTWSAGVQLRGVFRDGITYGDALRAWVHDLRQSRVDLTLQLRERVTPVAGMSDGDRLYPFQRAGVNFLQVAGSALLGDEMGTGKTIQLLEALNRMHDLSSNVLPAVVICPNSTKYNWALEAAIWCPDATPYVVTGGAAARAKILNAAAKDHNALIIVNIEAVRAHSRLAPFGSTRLARCPECDGRAPGVTATRCEVHPRQLNIIPLKTVVVDEAHRIKDPHAKQTRAAWAVGQGEHVLHRYALTGTPIANDPSDLWSIMHFVEPTEYPVKSPFVDRYCLVSWGAYGGMEVKGLRPDNRDEFHRILDTRFRRMPKALVLTQLPPKIRSRRVVELTPKQSKAYREIDTQLVTRLPDGAIMVASNDLTAQIRLLQFSSATMETTPDGFRMCDPSSKIDALVDILAERAGQPTVVCAEHRQLINLASARLTKLNITHGLIVGGQAEFERHATLRDFQEGKLDVLLFTIKAGGEGLTMTAADTIVFLQRSWSMIGNKQAEDRIHRIGSERHESIHIIDVIARDTIEETQVERLWEKAMRLDEITRDRARLAAAGISTADLDLEEIQIMNTNLGV